MQTILGAGGAVGDVLAKELLNYCDKVRLVGRNPKKVNASDEIFVADLTDAAAVSKAVAGSTVVYLCVGLPYSYKVWKIQWPLIMQNVINACSAHQAKLVFIDNVYMYAKTSIPHMTELSPMDPPSRKGVVRRTVVQMLLDAIVQGKIDASIARSADFYGPDIKSSVLKISVFDNFQKGKRAFWLADATKIHSFTYIPDLAKAVALLGNNPDTYGQIWHMPTSKEKLTGAAYIRLIAAEMKIKPKFYTLSKTMISLLGIFTPLLRELKEMQYQNDQDYFFDSSKFEQRFNFNPTSYATGIKQIVQEMK